MALSAAALAGMRATTAAYMPSTASFERRIDASTPGGNRNTMGGRGGASKPQVVPVDDMDEVPCHVHPDTQRGSGETEQQGVVAADLRWRIMFAHGTDARAGDVVTIDGRVYELVSDDTGRSDALEVECFAVRRS